MNASPLIIRLPNWLGDIAMSLPVIRAIAAENANTTLLGLAPFAPLLAQLLPNLSYQPLPAKNLAYYRHFWQQRHRYPRALLFANSQRADLEAFLLRAKHRYGISWAGRPRRLLNQRYLITHPEADGNRHQTQLWTDFTAHFDLQQGIDNAPFNLNITRANHIVLIAGSENNPEKRWPIPYWRQLISAILENSEYNILLSGTHKDAEITQEIALNFPPERVENLAGKTNLSEFLHQLASARVVIGNDTGGLHLANAVGTPSIGLYGPTNPQRTRPIFQAPLAIIQPDNCPAQGGGEMKNIHPEKIIKTLQNLNTL